MVYDIIGFIPQIYNLFENDIHSKITIAIEFLYFLKYKSLQNSIVHIEDTFYAKGIK